MYNRFSSPEVVLTFLLREEFACFCDRFEQRAEGAGLHTPQVRFEFGKCHFNGVLVRAVRRQEEKPVLDFVPITGQFDY